MADLFLKADAQNLLRSKSIFLVGDSNMRALYKDLVCLLTRGALMTTEELKRKGSANHDLKGAKLNSKFQNFLGEPNFLCDARRAFSGMTASNDYVEDRLFTRDNVRLEFNFTTRVVTTRMEAAVIRLARNPPDVIVVNSTLWDVNRWGPDSDQEFQKNLIQLMDLFKKHIPVSTMIVWLTALHPSTKEGPSPLILKELDYLKTILPYNILEANKYAAAKVKSYGYNVLDIHHYCRLLSHRRRPDGVHYSVTAVRYITNLTLTHIALSWHTRLPGRVKNMEVKWMEEAIATQRNTNPGQWQAKEFFYLSQSARASSQSEPKNTNIKTAKANSYTKQVSTESLENIKSAKFRTEPTHIISETSQTSSVSQQISSETLKFDQSAKIKNESAYTISGTTKVNTELAQTKSESVEDGQSAQANTNVLPSSRSVFLQTNSESGEKNQIGNQQVKTNTNKKRKLETDWQSVQTETQSQQMNIQSAQNNPGISLSADRKILRAKRQFPQRHSEQDESAIVDKSSMDVIQELDESDEIKSEYLHLSVLFGPEY